MIEPPVGSKWLGTQGNIFCRPTPLCKSHDRFQPGPAVVADTSWPRKSQEPRRAPV